MRELVSSTLKEKPMIALIDPEPAHGGLTMTQIQGELLEAEESYERWGFKPDERPSGDALCTHLFSSKPIEWNRIGCFRTCFRLTFQPPHASHVVATAAPCLV